MVTELPSAITDMTQLTHLNLSDNDIRLTEASAQRLASMVNLRELIMDNNPHLGVTPDVSAMSQLHRLQLVNTGLTQWPIGAETLARLEDLHLQENAISEIPEAVFTQERIGLPRRNVLLHDNPSRRPPWSVSKSTDATRACGWAVYLAPGINRQRRTACPNG